MMLALKRRLFLLVMLLSTLVMFIGEWLRQAVPDSLRARRSRASYGTRNLSERKARIKQLSGRIASLSRRLVSHIDD